MSVAWHKQRMQPYVYGQRLVIVLRFGMGGGVGCGALLGAASGLGCVALWEVEQEGVKGCTAFSNEGRSCANDDSRVNGTGA
eukprot:464452-Ditylum_brightwellii.AAC.1